MHRVRIRRHFVTVRFGGCSYHFQRLPQRSVCDIKLSCGVAVLSRAAQGRPACSCGVLLVRCASSSADVLAWPPGHRGMPWWRLPDLPDVFRDCRVAAQVGRFGRLRITSPDGISWRISFPVFPCRFIRGHPLRVLPGPVSSRTYLRKAHVPP